MPLPAFVAPLMMQVGSQMLSNAMTPEQQGNGPAPTPAMLGGLESPMLRSPFGNPQAIGQALTQPMMGPFAKQGGLPIEAMLAGGMLGGALGGQRFGLGGALLGAGIPLAYNAMKNNAAGGGWASRLMGQGGTP